MILIGLQGRLREHRARLRRARLRTSVEWIDLSELPQTSPPLNLVLQIAGDNERDDPVPREYASLIVNWTAIPPDVELDDAIQAALATVYGFVVGYTKEMHEVCRWIHILAHSMARTLDLRALIVGESGVGKELVARAIHRVGGRRDAPFVAINCAALSRELATGELFGHERGAFTGAISRREGALRTAGEGVAFLDEIGDMPLDLQTQLLRALEQRAFSPVGADKPIALGAQVLAATNRPLAPLIEQQRFRADLFFRLAQVEIFVPNLSQRVEDIPLLVREVWRRSGYEGRIEDDVVIAVQKRAWRGNIRELRSAVERVIIARAAGDLRPVGELIGSVSQQVIEPSAPLAQHKKHFERDVLEAVLRRVQGNVDLAARDLGVTKRTIYNLMRRHRVARKV
jgi:DNA-binding NtrC family response regulator